MLVAKGSSPNELMDEMQDALHDLGVDIETYAKQLEKLVSRSEERRVGKEC